MIADERGGPMCAHRSHPQKSSMPAISGIGTALPFRGCLHHSANDDMPVPAQRPAHVGRTLAFLVLGRLLLGAGGIALISVGTSLTGCGR